LPAKRTAARHRPVASKLALHHHDLSGEQGSIFRMAALQLLSWWRRARMSLDFDKRD